MRIKEAIEGLEHLTVSAYESYWGTALWSSTDDRGDPMDRDYGIENVDCETLKKQAIECNSFLQRLVEEKLLERALEYACLDHILHDFWLTRNHHGAGFWDGDYRCKDGSEDIGEDLTKIAQEFKEIDLYVADDDGLIFAYP